MSQANQIKPVVIISNQEIDDIMTTALEGGINYWVAGKVRMLTDPTGEFEAGKIYASDLISRNGSIEFTDDDGEVLQLDKTKFKKGLGMAMADGNGFDREGYDASDADRVIQYAVYDKLVWG